MRFASALLFLSSIACAQESPVSPPDLKNYPDSFRQVTIVRKDVTTNNGPVIIGRNLGSKVLQFDAQGRLIHELNYDESGNLYFGTDYVYSADGSQLTTRDAEDTLDINAIFYYDKDGDLIRKSTFDGTYITEYTYTTSKVLLHSVENRYDIKDGKSVITTHVEAFYDSLGREVESIYARRYGKDKYDPISVTHSTYDSLGRLIEKKYVDENGKMTMIKEYAYNAAGNQTREKITHADFGLNREGQGLSVYTYDAHGNLTSETFGRGDDALVLSYEVTYNEQGLPVKCLLSTSNDGRSMYTWIYSTVASVK